MSHPALIFDRNRLRQHRDRASATISHSDFLFRECARLLADRLPDINRTFPRVLDLGAHHGYLHEYISHMNGIEWMVQADLSARMITHAKGARVVCDEEFLPFADASFDLVTSVFSLHWINDLPGTLIQINRMLKPGGLMMVMLPGGKTLMELRQSFEHAELAITGGLSPRVSPFVDTRDGAGLLQRAGFTSPVADSDTLNIHYDNPLKLVEDLRASGETNTLLASAKGCMRRSIFDAAMDYYQEHFAQANGKVTASCEVVTLTGWKKDA